MEVVLMSTQHHPFVSKYSKGHTFAEYDFAFDDDAGYAKSFAEDPEAPVLSPKYGANSIDDFYRTDDVSYNNAVVMCAKT